MAVVTRSLSSLVIAWVLQVAISMTTEEGVISISPTESLPSLPLLSKALVITLPDVENGVVPSYQNRTGAEQQEMDVQDQADAQKATVPEEDLSAIRATEVEVPQEVRCYHDLKLSMDNQKAVADKFEEQESDAKERLATAKHRMAESLKNAHKFKLRAAKALEQHQEAQKAYRQEHAAALNVFETAKGDQGSYEIERKKVDLDAKRSKQVLHKYLEFKKKFIQASVDSEDPKHDKQVQQYKKLSGQYLASYNELQASIKRSYIAARKYSDKYTQLSEQYQQLASKANDIGTQVTKSSNDLVYSRVAHKEHQNEFSEHSRSVQQWERRLEQRQEAARAARNKYEELSQKTNMSKSNYVKLAAVANKYTALAEQKKRIVQLNRVRLSNFQQELKDSTDEIEAAIKNTGMLKRKFETAEAAGLAFMRAYRANGCVGILAGSSTGLVGRKLLQVKDEQKQSGAEHDKQQGAADDQKESADQQKALDTKSEQVIVQQQASASELGSEEEQLGYSAAQCESDKKVATANLEAAEVAKQAHQESLVNLKGLREGHDTSESGANNTKVVIEGADSKVLKYEQIAKEAGTKALNPCTINSV